MKHEGTAWRLYGNTSSEPEKDTAPATLGDPRGCLASRKFFPLEKRGTLHNLLEITQSHV